jgi:hypothetical protein
LKSSNKKNCSLFNYLRVHILLENFRATEKPSFDHYKFERV